MKDKTEFPSLLSPGIHDIHISQLESRFVVPFPDQNQRKNLLGRFFIFHSKLTALGVSFEIWIDGSFTTEKGNPDDIDLVIFGDPVHVNALSIDKKNEFQSLTNNANTKIRYLCDVYFIESTNVPMRSYWRGWYGYTRNEQAKGFVRLMY